MRRSPPKSRSLPELGITSLKVFTAYNDRLRLSDGEIFQVYAHSQKTGMLTLLHAENGDVIDILVAEALAAGHTSPEWHARTRPAWGAVEAVLARRGPGGPGWRAAVYRAHERWPARWICCSMPASAACP